MSEIQTALKSQLPSGNWGLLLKFTDCVYIPYTQLEAEYLSDVMNDELLVKTPPRIEVDDGNLISSFHMEHVTGEQLLEQSAILTLRGIRRLGMTPQLRARTIPIVRLNPNPGTLGLSFRHSLCDDVSSLFDAALHDARETVTHQFDGDTDYELLRMLESA